jgi:hypothetical protein
MAFARKGFRRLVVGGQVFFWRYNCQDPVVRAGYAHSPVALALPPHLDHVVVRPEDEPHRLLHVSCGYRCPLVTPGVIRVWIDTAAKLGWPGARRTLELDGLDAQGRIGPGSPVRQEAEHGTPADRPRD